MELQTSVFLNFNCLAEVVYQAENYCDYCGGLPAGLPPQIYDQTTECDCSKDKPECDCEISSLNVLHLVGCATFRGH